MHCVKSARPGSPVAGIISKVPWHAWTVYLDHTVRHDQCIYSDHDSCQHCHMESTCHCVFLYITHRLLHIFWCVLQTRETLRRHDLPVDMHVALRQGATMKACLNLTRMITQTYRRRSSGMAQSGVLPCRTARAVSVRVPRAQVLGHMCRLTRLIMTWFR